MEQLPLKRQVKRRLIFGIFLVILSLVIGVICKLVIIPILLLPNHTLWKNITLIVYGASWLMLLAGFFFAGKEGYILATHRYREFHNRTINQMKAGGVKAAGVMVKSGKFAARGTAKVITTGAKIPVHVTKHAAQHIREHLPKKDDLVEDLTFMSHK
jgi:hypothetical protein